MLLGGALLAAAWVVVPLVQQRRWAAVNEPLQGSGLVNGYGARRVLDWLVSGQLLDLGAELARRWAPRAARRLERAAAGW